MTFAVSLADLGFHWSRNQGVWGHAWNLDVGIRIDWESEPVRGHWAAASGNQSTGGGRHDVVATQLCRCGCQTDARIQIEIE